MGWLLLCCFTLAVAFTPAEARRRRRRRPSTKKSAVSEAAARVLLNLRIGSKVVETRPGQAISLAAGCFGGKDVVVSGSLAQRDGEAVQVSVDGGYVWSVGAVDSAGRFEVSIPVPRTAIERLIIKVDWQERFQAPLHLIEAAKKPAQVSSNLASPHSLPIGLEPARATDGGVEEIGSSRLYGVLPAAESAALSSENSSLEEPGRCAGHSTIHPLEEPRKGREVEKGAWSKAPRAIEVVRLTISGIRSWPGENGRIVLYRSDLVGSTFVLGGRLAGGRRARRLEISANGGKSWSVADWGSNAGFSGLVHFDPEGEERLLLRQDDVQVFCADIEYRDMSRPLSTVPSVLLKLRGPSTTLPKRAEW